LIVGSSAFRSAEAERKTRRKRTRVGEPCHSRPTLLRHLALRCRTTIRLVGTNGNFDRLTEPPPVQACALAPARTPELPPESRTRQLAGRATAAGKPRPAT
jgi:hypothetical protein